MKCPECAAETPDETPLCIVCGAPAARQPSVPVDPADGPPGSSLGTALGPATSAGPTAWRDRGTRLRVAGAIVAIAAAAVIIAACVLPFVRWRDGTSFSAWNNWEAGYVLEPLAVAVLGLVAGIMMVSGRRPGHRWVAAGMLLASGTQTLLLFWGCSLLFTRLARRPARAWSAWPAG
jgi:hypothetical protein